MKFIVNLKDLTTGNIVERKIDNKVFEQKQLATNFALECQYHFTLVANYLDNFGANLSPITVKYYVEEI